jgi:hypothetical protein
MKEAFDEQEELAKGKRVRSVAFPLARHPAIAPRK